MPLESNKLEATYNDEFSQEYVNILCDKIAFLFVKKYFIEDTIDNLTYEKDVFKIIKKLIKKDLESHFVYKKDFYKDLSVYIFKVHFKDIFKKISEELIVEISRSNKKVIDFLRYYALDIIVVDGKKYRVPELREDDKHKWNISSLPTILKAYVNAEVHIGSSKNKIKELEEKVLSFYVNGLAPMQHNQMIQDKQDELELEITKNKERILIIHDALSIYTNPDDLENTNQELENEKEKRTKLKEQKSILTKQKIKQIKILSYEKTLLEIESIKREYKNEYDIIEKKKNTYISIRNSLVKALTSKKTAV